MTIRLLDSKIINQIAAGEVIENPSALIKELIENSIDANSNQIEIIIENSGFTKIQIKDNGDGITKEDLLKAPLRHATSKIKNFDDLYNINTLGFRGEALASIFSVAKSKIISRVKDNEAYEISYQNLEEIKLSASEYGTTIIIEDLFYNTPARKKYLKSENKEFKLILDVVNKFLLIYNNIKFTLKHNNKLIINKPIFKSKEENIYYILGTDLKNNLLKVENQVNGISINGFISKPSNLTYPVKKNQYLFVNNRYIKSKLINDAIYEGFGTNLMEARHPLFILNIQIDPSIIDVNVHPSKIEIRFENELEIYNFIRSTIQNIFKIQETFKPFEPEKIKERDTSLNNKIENLQINKKLYNPNKSQINTSHKSYFSTETQKPLQVKENYLDYNQDCNNNSNNGNNSSNFKEFHEKEEVLENKNTTSNNPILNTDNKNINEEKSNENNYGPLYDRLKEYRIIGQINKTFIILETPIEMIIIDQHVAEEKFYYEKFKSEIENKKITSQILLKSEIISLSNSEMILYKENLNLLNKLGFESEEFSGNEIIVRAVPIGIRNSLLSAKIIKDILHEITVDNKFKLLENKKIEKLASIACKKSIKAGFELTNVEIKQIIEQLKRLKEPFNCPHGRPILLNWSFTDLEKKFKRIV